MLKRLVKVSGLGLLILISGYAGSVRAGYGTFNSCEAYASEIRAHFARKGFILSMLIDSGLISQPGCALRLVSWWFGHHPDYPKLRAAHLGMTALVEREHLGGICLNRGCIPTNALLRSSATIPA